MKIPRKLKKKIPKGVYCYEPLSYDNKTGALNIKPCFFYKKIKNKDKPEELQDELDKEYPEEKIGWCKILQCDIDDQCKMCDTKRDF